MKKFVTDEKLWAIDSWRKFPIKQQPDYVDQNCLGKLKSKEPIVQASDVKLLREKLKRCHDNKIFILQVGDCAEKLADAEESIVRRKIEFYNSLSHLLQSLLGKEVITIGRIGGQYAKPRSSPFEQHNGEIFHVYRGDIVNEFAPDSSRRQPDPQKMLQGYGCAKSIMEQISTWNREGEKSLDYYRRMAKENKYDLVLPNRLNQCYDSFTEVNFPRENSIFSSHEGLLLDFEECFLKEAEGKIFDLSAHFLWIGERTNNLGEAHVEFFRGVANPLGIKISARTTLSDLIKMIEHLNPSNQEGKIVLITRFGYDKVSENLPILCKGVKEAGLNVIFMCDPNHGNTKVDVETQKKVRFFSEMEKEVEATARILLENDCFLSGLHLEASCFHVTECKGGAESAVNYLKDDSYTTYCDPRLSMNQTYEMCEQVGKLMTTKPDGRASETKTLLV